jgi:hypothetical protein
MPRSGVGGVKPHAVSIPIIIIMPRPQSSIVCTLVEATSAVLDAEVGRRISMIG